METSLIQKYIRNVSAAAAVSISALLIAGCNFLDQEPERQGTLEEALADVNSAREFLYSCYSFMPASADHNGEPQLQGASDECYLSSHWATDWHYSKAPNLGIQTAGNPIYNYWSYFTSTTQPSRCKAYNLYGAIRQCYTLLNRIKDVPGISQADIDDISSQARFLVAYYHYVLLRLYGPIVIVEDELPLDAPDEIAYPKRVPYDKCVQWLSDRFDEVAAQLPPTRTADMWGAPTSVVAKALKARMLLYAASPLFNGNAEYWSDFRNKDGEPLMNLEYDKEKWKKAMDAAQEAIDLADQSGHGLFRYPNLASGSSDFERGYMNERYKIVTMPSEGNTDIIWAYTGSASNLSVMNAVLGLSPGSTSVPYGGVSPSFLMVETYLTENGLPIDKDPEFDYENRYGIADIPGTGEQTAVLNLHREPRFYADIAYDRADRYELNGSQFTLYFRQGEVNPETGLSNGNTSSATDFVCNGYMWKKYVHPDNSYRDNKSSEQKVAMPLVRYAELLLDYAEAYYEYYGKLDGQALDYIDAIRTNAGIPTVEDAWEGIPGCDDREIIRQERTIELMYEGHRFFDARRWKTAHLTFATPQKRWNGNAEGSWTRDNPQPASDYYRLMDTREGAKTFNVPQHYLYPLDARDIDINVNLVNNPGW